MSGYKLNVGCGRDVRKGWLNLDAVALPGVDLVFDLLECGNKRIPLPDNSVEEFQMSHILEHIPNALPLMEELYRLAKPDAICTVRVPYGSSDDAWADPTHVRPYFESTFNYFAQPWYWRADYGYRGDWQTGYILFAVDRVRFQGVDPELILTEIRSQRNVVIEMIVILQAIKPIREAKVELQKKAEVEIQLVPE